MLLRDAYLLDNCIKAAQLDTINQILPVIYAVMTGVLKYDAKYDCASEPAC